MSRYNFPAAVEKPHLTRQELNCLEALNQRIEKLEKSIKASLSVDELRVLQNKIGTLQTKRLKYTHKPSSTEMERISQTQYLAK